MRRTLLVLELIFWGNKMIRIFYGCLLLYTAGVLISRWLESEVWLFICGIGYGYWIEYVAETFNTAKYKDFQTHLQ